MDETMMIEERGYRREGFPGQRLCVVPRPQVETALLRPATRRLIVTDAGYFPSARGHRRARSAGTDEVVALLCVAGTGTVRLGGETHTLVSGSCVSIPARTPHEYEASRHDPWTIWWMHVRGSDAAELAGGLLDTPRPVTRLRAVDRTVALFDELVGVLEGRLSPAQLLTASGIAWQLLTRIAADSVLPADGSPLERAMRYLEARIEGSIRVDDLAAMVGLSASHLTALFRQATGGGPGAFHASLKMARARTLLDTTTMTIGEIAGAVGYQDPLYFSRHFRHTHGVSPTQYRAQQKG